MSDARVGDLARLDEYDPWERAAARVRFAAQPWGGRQGDPARIGDIAAMPLNAMAGFVQSAYDRAAEEHGGAAQISTDYDPRRLGAQLGAETAMNVVGTPALTGGVPAGAMGSAAKGIKAYHGSPHDFDRFDMSKIGTGEGAQAYGHGLYFAENEAVARDYRNKLAVTRSKLPDDMISMPPKMRQALMAHADTDADALTAAKRAQYMAPELRQDDPAKLADMIERARDAKRGKMYEVNINAHPDQFLDWDKPLSGQPANVQKFVAGTRQVNNRIRPEDTGFGIYGATGRGVTHNNWRGYGAIGERADRAASDALREAGIPGIKYLDQGSRNPGWSSLTPAQLDGRIEQLKADIAGGFGDPQRMKDKLTGLEAERDSYRNLTSNYVLFDDKIIDILKKYGIAPGAALPPMLGGIAAQDEYRQ